MPGYRYTLSGLVPVDDDEQFDQTQQAATPAPQIDADNDAEDSNREQPSAIAARRPVSGAVPRVAEQAPVARTAQRGAPAQLKTPRDVIKAARARLREVNREIARLVKLTAERDALKRLLDAAADTNPKAGADTRSAR